MTKKRYCTEQQYIDLTNLTSLRGALQILDNFYPATKFQHARETIYEEIQRLERKIDP